MSIDPSYLYDLECAWKEDSEGTWTTSCGQAHQFTHHGPKENKYEFCPYCGGDLNKVAYKEVPI